MRKVLIFCIIIFSVLLVFPVTASFVSEEKEIINKNIVKTTFASTSSDEENTDIEEIVRLAMSLCSEDFSNEGLKAVLTIAKNNLKSTNNRNINTDYSEFSDEFYQRVSKIYNEVDAKLTYKGEAVYIPTSSLSKGYTEADEEYTYMKSVASPWDCYCEEFIYEKEYSAGVSIWGLNYLCEEGLTYKEALKWYLPEFEVK